jgi:hypothetical protein
MNQNVGFKLLVGLVVLAVLAGVGSLVYRAGMTQGLLVGTLISSASAKAGDPASPLAQAAPYLGGSWSPYAGGWHYGPPFMGFGCFGVLIPIILLFLFFGFMRRMFWHGRYGHAGPWGHYPGGWQGWGNPPGQPGQAGQPNPAGPTGQPGEPGQQAWMPPFFEEWHRRAHQAEQPPDTEQPPAEE